MRDRSAVEGERTFLGTGEAAPPGVRLQKHAALAVVGILGAGLLGWYYQHLSAGPGAGAAHEHMRSRPASNTEMKLPALEWGPSSPPATSPGKMPGRRQQPASEAPAKLAETGVEAPSPEPALRTHASPVLIHATSLGRAEPVDAPPLAGSSIAAAVAGVFDTGAAAESGAPLRRTPGPTPEYRVAGVAEARLVPDQRWLLPRGAFIDCTLETAIDSTLPGMTTCVLAADVFGADGRVVLLERGTRLVGETQTEIGGAQARIAVIWTEARTPTGVLVPLSSPGTDALGGTGVPGSADRHFGERFGAAVLLSLINGGVGAVVAHQQGPAGVVYSVQGSQDVGTEALRATAGIRPTIRVVPGARIQVLVARDVDFRSVYRLARTHDG